MLTSLYYGYWDYWYLNHKVTFDGINRLILVNDGVTSLDMQIDVYSDWKEWVRLEQNLKYLPPFATVGGEPTIAGERLDVTYFLINGWKFKPYPGSYDLNIIGNVYDIDGEDIKVPANIISGEPNNITITTNRSNIVRQIDVSSGGSTGSFDPNTIVSASLFGIQEDTLYNIEGRVISIENILSAPITASLEPTQAAQLTNIENLVTTSSLDIESLLVMNYSQSLILADQTLLIVSQSQQITYQSELIVSQSLQLDSIESMIFSISTGSITDDRIREIWELHGLDNAKPLTVSRTKRLFGSVDQNILTVGTGSAQVTTITRN